MKKNIAVISTKGGVGKSTISEHLLPYVLRDLDFQVIEIDDNNDTFKALQNSELLRDKITSCDIAKGTEKLEEIVIQNMLEDSNITIIDAGGGNDSKKVIESLKDQNMESDTLFIIPFFPDFGQIQNLFETVQLVQKEDYIVVLNSYAGTKEDDMFIDGNEDFEIENLSKIFKDRFLIIPKTNLFSFSSTRNKESIYDFAQRAFDFSQTEILEWAKKETKADKETMLSIYRDWKISNTAKQYLESEKIENFKAMILEKIKGIKK